MAEVQAAVIVAELTLVGARDMIRILSWMKSNAPQTTVMVAVNRVGPNGSPEISRKDFEASIEHAIDFSIPFDTKTACQAAKLGKPVAEVGRSTKIGHEIQLVANRLLAVADGEDVVGGERPSSLTDRIAGLKSLFTGKGKSKTATAE